MTLADRLRHALETGHGMETVLLTGDHRDLELDQSAPLMNAAVLVAVTDRSRPGVILTQRTDNLSRHPGQVAFPGGRIDPGDSGAIDAAALDADQLNATLVGSGGIKLGGRAAKVRLMTNGTGGIDAVPLKADDLILLLDGPGEIRATARFTANVTSTGLGSVTVYGKPACTVKAVAGGPVSCGKLPTP